MLKVHLVTRGTKLILALATPMGVLMTVVDEKKESSLPVPDKTRKVLSV